MKVHVADEDYGRNVLVYVIEEGFGRHDRLLRFLDSETVQSIELDEGVAVPGPTLRLPRQMATEIAKAILGKSGTASDEILEAYRVERRRVEKMLEWMMR